MIDAVALSVRDLASIGAEGCVEAFAVGDGVAGAVQVDQAGSVNGRVAAVASRTIVPILDADAFIPPEAVGFVTENGGDEPATGGVSPEEVGPTLAGEVRPGFVLACMLVGSGAVWVRVSGDLKGSAYTAGAASTIEKKGPATR